MLDSNQRPLPSQSSKLTSALIRDSTTKVLYLSKITKDFQSLFMTIDLLS